MEKINYLSFTSLSDKIDELKKTGVSGEDLLSKISELLNIDQSISVKIALCLSGEFESLSNRDTKLIKRLFDYLDDIRLGCNGKSHVDAFKYFSTKAKLSSGYDKIVRKMKLVTRITSGVYKWITEEKPSNASALYLLILHDTYSKAYRKMNKSRNDERDYQKELLEENYIEKKGNDRDLFHILRIDHGPLIHVQWKGTSAMYTLASYCFNDKVYDYKGFVKEDVTLHSLCEEYYPSKEEEKTETKSTAMSEEDTIKMIAEADSILEAEKTTIVINAENLEERIVAGEEKAKKEAIVKPPLGLIPRDIADLCRLKCISEAMVRYYYEGEKVPEEWIEELVELNNKL